VSGGIGSIFSFSGGQARKIIANNKSNILIMRFIYPQIKAGRRGHFKKLKVLDYLPASALCR